MTRAARLAAIVGCALSTVACGAEQTTHAGYVVVDHSPRLEEAFDGDPELLVVVRPKRLSHDLLYGPMIRRVTELASESAAVAAAVGTTALGALQRADEVIVCAYDARARDAFVAVRGVPAEVDPARVVDTNGAALWQHTRDLPRGVEELSPTDPKADAALFVLPNRAWIIAEGPAVARIREVYILEARATSSPLGGIDSEPLAIAWLRGDALVRARPTLSEGPLAPVTRDLDHVTVTLEPGPQGEVGEVVGRFLYGDAPFAAQAEPTINDALGAFTRAYEAKAPWLHAVKVARRERGVEVRGRIPRAWVDGFLHVEI